ncbi:4a-hydroxytetrahydrobiopterin dehydratase [Longispora albida]|uniref:4a-hydroxytetrahydrobiopterin dehydratase n=1 Tax=Longispora albida TaxID=203523 RepID=UPI000A051486|nr:4a-hydroxytetrahydrobiopterin dehydratase [Longispora albida]
MRDTLSQLDGWHGNSTEIQRSLTLDDSQHADLTERVKVFADALQLRPDIRRAGGQTHIRLRSPDGGSLTTSEVALAARIDTAYRAILS